MRLFDDYTKLKPGSVRELERELQELGGPAHNTQNLAQITYGVFRGLRRFVKNTFQEQQSDFNGGGILPLNREQSNTRIQSNAGLQPSSNGVRQQDSLHLLLCIDKARFKTLLLQERLDKVSTDSELFLFLQSRYSTRWDVRNRFTLRHIGSLSLTRVCTVCTSLPVTF